MSHPLIYHSEPTDPPALAAVSDLTIAGLLDKMTAVIRMKPSHPRVAHACDHCRRRKTKCSGEQPVCSSCDKRGRLCQWTPIKKTKDRRSRKPYDSGIPYQPRSYGAPRVPHLPFARPTYPSVLLPDPSTFWPIDDDVFSLPQKDPIINVPVVDPLVQAPTGWNSSMLHGWQELGIDPQWLPSPSSSCPSMRSDISSCGSSPLRTVQESSVSVTSPLHSSVEELRQTPDNLEDFLLELYRYGSPEWCSPSGHDELESLFI